jgi:molecular chaperone DnaJ
VETGLRLQLPGSGEVGKAGGPNGDLYVEVTVSPHASFSRDGDDLLATLEVSMSDAILGTETAIDGLDGEVDLEIRPGVQSGDVLTIKGRGITPLRGTQRGDLRVGVQVVTPTKLDSAQRSLIEDFAKKQKAPGPQLAQFQQGLFSKLRDRFRH